MPGTLEPALKAFYPLLKPGVKTDEMPCSKAFNECAEVLSEALEGRDYLLGRQFTTADILVGAALFTAMRLNLLNEYPVLREYVDRLRHRRPCQQAILD